MVEDVKQATKTYELEDGTAGSRAAYIRQEFMKGRTRREIADELGVLYNIVHSATANMDNGTVGKAGARVMIELEDGKKMPRAEYIRERIGEGASRGELAKELNVSYGVVYAASKGMDITGAHGGKVMVKDPETGEDIARVDLIRKLYAEGKKRREIANTLGCDYSVVWTATRERAEAEAKAEETEETEDTE